jgi:hypothetical protein
MSEQYPGGFISKNAPTVSTSSAQGLWTLSQQAGYQKQGLWPSPPPPVNITWGTPVNFYAGVISYPIGVSLQDSGKVALVYQDESSGGPDDLTRCVIGTISGTSISFGTPVSINTHGISSDARNITYDPTNARIVWTYREPINGYGAIKIGTVSGTSSSWGSQVIYNSGTTRWMALAYSTTASKFVVSYQDAPNSADGVARVGTVSGTTASFGTATTFESGSVCALSSCYDSLNNAIGILYNDVSIGYTQVIKGTISGTGISFGSAATFDTSTGNPQTQFATQLSFNSTEGKAVGLSWTYTPSNFFITTTVSFASATPVVGTKVTISGPTEPQTVASVSGSNFVAAGYNASSPTGYSTRKGTISGSTVSYASAELISATAGNGYIFYDSVSNKVVYVYKGPSNYGYAVVGTVN